MKSRQAANSVMIPVQTPSHMCLHAVHFHPSSLSLFLHRHLSRQAYSFERHKCCIRTERRKYSFSCWQFIRLNLYRCMKNLTEGNKMLQYRYFNHVPAFCYCFQCYVSHTMLFVHEVYIFSKFSLRLKFWHCK